MAPRPHSLPAFETAKARIEVMLFDCGGPFCGTNVHPHELYFALNGKVTDEFFRGTLRETF